MILIPIFVIGHKSNDFRFMDYKSKIKIINHKSMNWLSNKLFYTIGITLLCGGLHAQSLAEAKKLYNEGKYAEAKPAFEKLVKQAPSNSSYNHWYGVCCYETGDLTGAEKHLKVAVKRKVQEAYRYMSEVYYKTIVSTKPEKCWKNISTCWQRKSRIRNRSKPSSTWQTMHNA